MVKCVGHCQVPFSNVSFLRKRIGISKTNHILCIHGCLLYIADYEHGYSIMKTLAPIKYQRAHHFCKNNIFSES